MDYYYDSVRFELPSGCIYFDAGSYKPDRVAQYSIKPPARPYTFGQSAFAASDDNMNWRVYRTYESSLNYDQELVDEVFDDDEDVFEEVCEIVLEIAEGGDHWVDRS